MQRDIRMSAIHAAIAEIENRIQRLQDAKATLLSLDSAASPIERRTTPERRQKATGTDALVLSVLKDGPQSIKQLTKACKVKEGIVRDSIKRLNGRIVTVPKSWPRQFELKK